MVRNRGIKVRHVRDALAADRPSVARCCSSSCQLTPPGAKKISSRQRADRSHLNCRGRCHQRCTENRRPLCLICRLNAGRRVPFTEVKGRSSGIHNRITEFQRAFFQQRVWFVCIECQSAPPVAECQGEKRNSAKRWIATEPLPITRIGRLRLRQIVSGRHPKPSDTCRTYFNRRLRWIMASQNAMYRGKCCQL